MVAGKLLSQVDLFGAQTLCIYELIKVVIIYENEHLVFAAFQIMMLYLKSFYNN